MRRRAAEALEAMGPEAAGSIPALLKLVRDDPAPRARKEAAESLLRIGPEGSKAVSSMLDDASPETRLAAVSAAGISCHSSSAGVASNIEIARRQRSAHSPRLPSMLFPEPDRRRIRRCRPWCGCCTKTMCRCARNAIYGLASMQQQGLDLRPATPEILKLVDDKDDSVRRCLAGTLGGMGRTAGFAFRQLGEKSDQRAIESGRQFLMIAAIEKLLGDEKSYVRARACDSLREIGPDASHAATALKPLLKDMAVVESEGRICNCAGEASRQDSRRHGIFSKDCLPSHLTVCRPKEICPRTRRGTGARVATIWGIARQPRSLALVSREAAGPCCFNSIASRRPTAQSGHRQSVGQRARGRRRIVGAQRLRQDHADPHAVGADSHRSRRRRNPGDGFPSPIARHAPRGRLRAGG